MSFRYPIFFIPFLVLSSLTFANYSIDGELKQWHKVTLTFDGPESSEDATPNPFLDYRLQVRFTNGNRSYLVPGYFAADGEAANSSATSGNQWRVHFMPDAVGQWDFEARFRQGENVAVSDNESLESPSPLTALKATLRSPTATSLRPICAAKAGSITWGNVTCNFTGTGNIT